MRIYAVADIHSRPGRMAVIRDMVVRSKPDLLVVAGDLTRYVNPLPVVTGLGDMPAPVLAVRGNSDLPRLDRLLDLQPNITVLDLNEVKVNGVSFVGVSGAVPVPFSTRLRWREGRLRKRVEALVTRESVLVAHPPPYGTLDDVFPKFGRLHAGCRSLRAMVLKRRPRLLICGHIHERPGAAYLGRTLVVNCAMGRTGAGAIIEYENGRPPEVEMIF